MDEILARILGSVMNEGGKLTAIVTTCGVCVMGNTWNMKKMLNDYLRAALSRAQYQLQEDESVTGEIPDFENVRAQGETLEICQQELLEALEEWVFFRVSRQLPLPTLDGIQLRQYEVM